MRLPDGDRADLGTKLEDYVLNMLHPGGRHKARVFESVLGITAANAHVLRRALLDAAATSDEVEAQGDTGFGTVLGVWVMRYGEDFPRLTTCYIV